MPRAPLNKSSSAEVAAESAGPPPPPAPSTPSNLVLLPNASDPRDAGEADSGLADGGEVVDCGDDIPNEVLPPWLEKTDAKLDMTLPAVAGRLFPAPPTPPPTEGELSAGSANPGEEARDVHVDSDAALAIRRGRERDRLDSEGARMSPPPCPLPSADFFDGPGPGLPRPTFRAKIVCACCSYKKINTWGHVRATGEKMKKEREGNVRILMNACLLATAIEYGRLGDFTPPLGNNSA